MLTVKKPKDIPENWSDKTLFIPQIFSEKTMIFVMNLSEKNRIAPLSVGLATLTKKVFSDRHSEYSRAYISKTGDITLVGAGCRKNSIGSNCIVLYEQNSLWNIFLSTKQRFEYSKKVINNLKEFHNLDLWKQCIQKQLNLSCVLGTGCYGNVYKGFVKNTMFAVKQSKIKPEESSHPFNKDFSSWHELFFLQDMIAPLIRKGICPNLPLLYDVFTCDDCDLSIKGKNLNCKCVITVVEYAQGDFNKFIKSSPKIAELESALFQIMAGLHAIQFHLQIMNYDIKKENILYYDVVPGGFWQYTIHGKDYYVPNYGKLFIINDFGISRTMSPNFKMYKNNEEKSFRLGSRYAFIENSKFVPFQIENSPKDDTKTIKWYNGLESLGTSSGTLFRIDRDSGKSNLPIEVFKNAELFPPFEFYNDTQDVIRMFIGGKRTTQKGDHSRIKNLPKSMLEKLKKFSGTGENCLSGIFSNNPALVLAGYFIQEYFTNYKSTSSNILEKFKIS